nr:GNAT family N-acetyltransferase [Zhihengliuella halotolerans]
MGHGLFRTLARVVLSRTRIKDAAMGEIQLRRLVTADDVVLRAATHANMNWRGRERFSYRQIDTQSHFRQYCRLDPERGDFGFVAEIDGQPVGVVWCLFLDADHPGYGYIGDGVPELSLSVWSGYRGAGLGQQLLSRALDAARKQRIARISLSVEAANVSAVRLYRRVGFRPSPEAIDEGTYVIELSSVAVRPERPSEKDRVREVVSAAFATEAEADLVDALRREPEWMPGLAWVGEDPERGIVAHALLTRCRIGEADALALAPCAVDPAEQRRGVGTAVISGALEAARERGERYVVVLGHSAYYPRFGFRAASAFGVDIPGGAPDGALMVLDLGGAWDVPAGTVEYAAPFGL